MSETKLKSEKPARLQEYTLSDEDRAALQRLLRKIAGAATGDVHVRMSQGSVAPDVHVRRVDE